MSHLRTSKRFARVFTVMLGVSLLSAAAPAVSQARRSHHLRPAAGHTAPYTRLFTTTIGF
jgi:hypothetical protein